MVVKLVFKESTHDVVEVNHGLGGEFYKDFSRLLEATESRGLIPWTPKIILLKDFELGEVFDFVFFLPNLEAKTFEVVRLSMCKVKREGIEEWLVIEAYNSTHGVKEFVVEVKVKGIYSMQN